MKLATDRRLGCALLTTATLALAGCSPSGPSEAEVRAAMLRPMEELLGKKAAQEQKAEFDKIKVGKCEKSQLETFVCEIESPAGRVMGRFKKEKDGWVVLGPAF